MTPTVLVVEDEPLVREALGQTLELASITPILTSAFVVAKDHIDRDFPGIILSDIRMPGRDGLYLLDYVKSVDPDLPVILLTGEGDIPMAVDAIRKGAFDFLEKPCANDVLVDAVRRAQRTRALVLENRRLKEEIRRGDAASQMIFGLSEKAEALREQVRNLARIDDAVLVYGEVGTGIPKVAEVIHRLSRRAAQTFGKVAGAGLLPSTLSDALTEHSTGTLFIDDAAAMPKESQFALLEHLDSVGGARILVGWPKDNRSEVQTEILPDLQLRLDALKLGVPSLRERTEDIPILFHHYVREAAEQLGVAEPEVTASVLSGLMGQSWPGNARALRNAAVRYVLGLDSPIDDSSLGLSVRLAEIERSLISDALARHKGNATATAQSLQLPRKTFYDKLNRLGLKPEDFR